MIGLPFVLWATSKADKTKIYSHGESLCFFWVKNPLKSENPDWSCDLPGFSYYLQLGLATSFLIVI